MTNVAVERIDRGLLKVLTLARRSTHLAESGVLNGASRTHPADGWASGCRRVRTTRSVGSWRARLEESEAEGLMDERSFGHRGGGWMPNQRVERTAAERLGFYMAGFMNIIRHSLSARSAAVAHSGRWAD